MTDETISSRNTGSLVVLIILSSTILSGAATLGQDTWISILLGAAISAPLIWVYCRIVRLFPGMDIFTIIQSLFGKVISSIIIALMSWYALHLSALVLRSFTEYTVIIALQETPRIPIMIIILAGAIYLAKSGFNIIGRWSMIICVTVLANLLFTLLLSSRSIDLSNIQPVFDHSLKHIASDTLTVSTVVFRESIIILVLFGAFRKGDSPYKAYFSGLAIGALALTLVILRNLFVLGPALMINASFPSYMSVRTLYLGSFLERIESIISFNLILLGITKIALCLCAASMGAAKLFHIKDHIHIVMPVSLLTLALCSILFESVTEMIRFVEASRFYALPFQVIIPLVIWIAAEIKHRQKTAIYEI